MDVTFSLASGVFITKATAIEVQENQRFFFFFNERSENFIWAKFEDNPGRASEKALRTLSYFLLSKILILAIEMKKKTKQNTSLSFWWQREEGLGAEVATQDDWMWLWKPCHQTNVKLAMRLYRCQELAEVRKLPSVRPIKPVFPNKFLKMQLYFPIHLLPVPAFPNVTAESLWQKPHKLPKTGPLQKNFARLKFQLIWNNWLWGSTLVVKNKRVHWRRMDLI